MRSTFHEPELGQAVIQNTTAVGPEQLIVTLESETPAAVRVQIKEGINGDTPVTSSINVDQRGLQMLFRWLREQGIVS